MYVCVDDLFIGVNKEIKYILIDFFEHFAFLFLYFLGVSINMFLQAFLLLASNLKEKTEAAADIHSSF